ncbi:MAG: TetR/AcrR family transcriptional regulator [Litoreibacter sp.]
MSIDTKTALLNSAERAARTLGFDGFSYADLAEDVGIRKASIHHHFPSKANLSVELMHRYYLDLERICADINENSTSGGARLTALIQRYYSGLDGGKSLCLCVSFTTSLKSLPPEAVQQINRFRAMMIDWLEITFETGRADGSIANVTYPALEAAAALPLFEGAQLAARTEENPELFDNALQLLRSRITT